MKLLKKAFTLITGKKAHDKRPLKGFTERELIELESEVGRTIFGAVPAGVRREFFCLDAETWVWYEEWTDEYKQKRTRTTRYELHEKGILKVQDSKNYQFLDSEELKNFEMATRVYYERIMRGIYKRDPYTGQLLTEVPATIE